MVINMEGKKLRVALIGAGQIARTTHIPNYLGMDDVELVGICDTRLDSARQLAEQFGIPFYCGDHKELLKQQEPDAVSICVPNKFHAALTLDALRAGCHVLCEKPPAISFDEALKMEQAATEENKILTYGFHMRHAAQVSLLKEKIAAGELGEIYTAKAVWLRRRGIPGWGVFTNRDIQGGGPLIDIGAHMLDTALYLLDYPEISYVCAASYDKIGKQGGCGLMGSWKGDTFTVEDSLFGQIYFKNGSSLRVESAFALHMKEKDVKSVQIFGDRAGAELFPFGVYGTDRQELTNQEYPALETEDLHKKELQQFVRACLGKEEILVKASQGTYVQRVLEALYASAKKGQPELF